MKALLCEKFCNALLIDSQREGRSQQLHSVGSEPIGIGTVFCALSTGGEVFFHSIRGSMREQQTA